MTFLMDMNPGNLACCIRWGAQIWNWTLNAGLGGWEAVPSTGNPAAAHLKQLSHTASGVGSLGYECTLQIPDVAAMVSGAWISVFACSSTGTLSGNPSDLLYCVPIAAGPPVVVNVGGVAR
jgi:hypothetical protein